MANMTGAAGVTLAVLAGGRGERMGGPKSALSIAGKPILRAPSVVSMGNPHAIFWVGDVNGYDSTADVAQDVFGLQSHFDEFGGQFFAAGPCLTQSGGDVSGTQRDAREYP